MDTQSATHSISLLAPSCQSFPGIFFPPGVPGVADSPGHGGIWPLSSNKLLTNVAERVGFHGGNRNSLRQKAALGATSRTRWIGQDRPGRVPPSAPEARGDGSMNRPLVAFGLPRPLPAL